MDLLNVLMVITVFCIIYLVYTVLTLERIPDLVQLKISYISMRAVIKSQVLRTNGLLMALVAYIFYRIQLYYGYKYYIHYKNGLSRTLYIPVMLIFMASMVTASIILDKFWLYIIVATYIPEFLRLVNFIIIKRFWSSKVIGLMENGVVIAKNHLPAGLGPKDVNNDIIEKMIGEYKVLLGATA